MTGRLVAENPHDEARLAARVLPPMLAAKLVQRRMPAVKLCFN